MHLAQKIRKFRTFWYRLIFRKKQTKISLSGANMHLAQKIRKYRTFWYRLIFRTRLTKICLSGSARRK